MKNRKKGSILFQLCLFIFFLGVALITTGIIAVFINNSNAILLITTGLKENVTHCATL